MEWMNRAGRPQGQQGQTVNPSTAANHGNNVSHAPAGKHKAAKVLSFANITSIILLISLTLISIAVIGFLMTTRQNDESRYVAEDKMQAVFLNGGQVYFGKIRELNNKYVGMNDIYYLRVNQQVQPKQGESAQQDISLVKLGCELHGPQDQMIINREQVVFWENLKDDGQVAKAVKQYKEANPNGQNCETNNGQSTTNQEKQTETTPAAETPSTNNTQTNP